MFMWGSYAGVVIGGWKGHVPAEGDHFRMRGIVCEEIVKLLFGGEAADFDCVLLSEGNVLIFTFVEKRGKPL